MDHAWAPLAVAALAVRLALAYDARREPACYGATQIRFRPGRYVRIPLVVGAAMVILALFDVFRHGYYAEMLGNWPWLLTLVAVFGAVGYGYPRTIFVDNKGVRLASYFGVGKRYIEWPSSHGVIERSTSRVYLCGADGQQIVHSRLHVDQLGFIVQMERHTVVYSLGSNLVTGLRRREGGRGV
jgi:hypothetical protein